MLIDDFVLLNCPILDVRSPSEFSNGHIPQAISFPLFSDQERSQVGLLYKTEGKENAIQRGLEYVGPKLASFVEQAKALAGKEKALRIYCWRGGMRSSSLAWLFEIAGLHCFVLEGGYKTFRRWTQKQFNTSFPFIVLGGFTGSGKTDVLKLLSAQKEQIIDLEAIAGHRGSSFGHLGYPQQVSPEQFENDLAWQLSRYDLTKAIWIEDESRMIGMCPIPEAIWKQMGNARFVWLDSPKEERVQRLTSSYGIYAKNDILSSIEKIVKKLGAVRKEQAVQHILKQEFHEAAALILEYYDKAYTHSCIKRHPHRKNVFRFSEDNLTELVSYAVSITA